MHEHTGNGHDAQMQALYREMAQDHLFPLWEVLNDIVLKEPCSRAMPALWHYDQARAYLMRAGDLISAEQAERRVLVLENPSLKGESAITPRLYAGLQLVLPGEVAPCHRHSQSALRFIMEGNGAYTAVDGEKAFMAPFDLILTPNWRWHDHGNDSADPVIWLDGLDVPLVRAMEGQFAERLGDTQHPARGEAGANRRQFGRGLRPLRSLGQGPVLPREPLFHYPYAEWMDALDSLARADAPDRHLGHALQFLNPVTGGAVMPTMSASVRLLPAGFETAPRRSTESAVYTVVEGTGEVEIGGTSFALSSRDLLVVPTWAETRWRANSRLVLFAFSDRVVQEALALYREQLN